MKLPEELIKKYLDGRISRAEARTVLQWFKTEEGQRYLEKNLGEDFESLNNRKWIFEQELDSARILKDIYQSSGKEGTDTSKKRKQSTIYRIAAGVILLLSVVSSYLYFTASQEIVYATRFGERKEITLPDHSKVILNGNSSP